MKTEKKYQICKNCVMDTSDPKITFDKNGVCDFCNNYYKNVEPNSLELLSRIESLL